MGTEICILHFNDVYHVNDVELISRFAGLIRSFEPRPLVIFSGDVFSPSLEASLLKGEHMIPFLNHLNVDVACYGNHDFDFGETRLVELSRKVEFPWVLSNATRVTENGGISSEPPACGERYIIRTVQGYKIGFIGLAGTDWPSNCQNLPPLYINDPAVVAQELARHLRLNEGCDFVIAISHLRLAEDIRTANAAAHGVAKVDLILGGHDHEVLHRFHGDTEEDSEIIQQGTKNEEILSNGVVDEVAGDIRIVKSGTNWRGLSVVRLIARRLPDGEATIETVKLKQYVDIAQSSECSSLSACPRVRKMAAEIQQRAGSVVQKPLVHTATPLDGRCSVIRSSETNLGNMLADAYRAYYGADIALVNSGSIRCDRIIEPRLSPLRVKDVIEICPFENPLLVKQVSGHALHQALENSVSDLHVDGRFMQCSGLHIVADWQQQEGHRILQLSLMQSPSMPAKRILPSQIYTVVMSSFIAAGFDGYTCFQSAETLVDMETAVTDTGLLLQIFGYDKEGLNDGDTTGIDRARRAIVCGMHGLDNLPVVSPVVEGRIRFDP
ncbi:trifunctional nucleotide phosphoesterase protein YfkN [Aspergillus udagawae]|nr:trifunctional nucleotide phosphoesterase protein YfkN [Aspergillus udagawae]